MCPDEEPILALTCVHVACSPPNGISESLMTMRIRLSGNNYATIVRAYAPTMTYPDEDKERFNESLKATMGIVPHSDKLTVLDDFNVRVTNTVEKSIIIASSDNLFLSKWIRACLVIISLDLVSRPKY